MACDVPKVRTFCSSVRSTDAKFFIHVLRAQAEILVFTDSTVGHSLNTLFSKSNEILERNPTPVADEQLLLQSTDLIRFSVITVDFYIFKIRLRRCMFFFVVLARVRRGNSFDFRSRD